MKPKYKVTNNFNSEVIYTTATGNDLKSEVKQESIKHNKKVTDYTITKIN
jgi:hypothetical protein